jgi:ketosteroid isomerase-like protein
MKQQISNQPSYGINLKSIVCFLVFFFLRFHSFAQDVQVENKIRELDEKQRAWMLKEDTDALKKIYDNDMLVNAPFNAVTSGSEAVFQLVQSGFIKLSSFTIKIEKVLIKDGVAVTMGSEAVTFDKNSSNPHAGQTIKRRFTHVYFKEGGSWKLIARHANEICQ